MRKVLYILAELRDQDLDWIAGVGVRETIPEGQVLVQQGQPIEVLYITLGGKFAVFTDVADVIAELGVGEVIGELSFLDARPPAASVRAIEKSTVLAVPVSRLQSKLQSDAGFASRFYKALGVFLAHRLRDTMAHYGYGSERRLDEDIEAEGEMSTELLDNMSLAGVRFDAIIRRLAVAGGRS
jgi:CRP-like cAMP-binding protein